MRFLSSVRPSNCNTIGNLIFVDSFYRYDAVKNSIETQTLDRFDMLGMAP